MKRVLHKEFDELSNAIFQKRIELDSLLDTEDYKKIRETKAKISEMLIKFEILQERLLQSRIYN